MIVSTTRPISCLTLRSRSGVPIWPRKYFETTMLVACCDQDFGNLDVALLEHHLAALVADDGRAQLPLDLVERIDAGFGEEARERQPGRRPRLLRAAASSRSRATQAATRLSFRCVSTDLLASTCGLVGSAFFHVPLRLLRGLPRIERSHSRPGAIVVHDWNRAGRIWPRIR